MEHRALEYLFGFELGCDVGCGGELGRGGVIVIEFVDCVIVGELYCDFGLYWIGVLDFVD